MVHAFETNTHAYIKKWNGKKFKSSKVKINVMIFSNLSNNNNMENLNWRKKPFRRPRQWVDIQIYLDLYLGKP